jgi:hypothetical protein
MTWTGQLIYIYLYIYSDWDSIDGDLVEDWQLAVEASLREENDRFLKDLEWALRLSSLGGKE